MLRRLSYEITTTIDLRVFLLSLSLAGILGIVLTVFYLNFRTDRIDSLKYAKILLPTLLIMTLTTAVISSSVSLALGLLGALSMIRFRMQPPGLEQILFLLMAMAAGVGLGKGEYMIVYIGVMGTLAVILISKKLLTKATSRLRVSIKMGIGPGLISVAELGEKVQKQIPALQFRHYVLESGTEEVVFRISMKGATEIQRLKALVREIGPQAVVSIEYDPE